MAIFLAEVKFAFSIYDFEGNETMDAFYMGECLRALNLNPTLAVLEKVTNASNQKIKTSNLKKF